MRTEIVAALVLGLLESSVMAVDNSPSRAMLGKKVDNISLADAGGKTQRLHDLKDKKAIVVVFLSFECPVANSYAQPLAEMAKTYGPRGVAFVGVSTNEDEDAAQLAKQVKEFNIPFAVHQDKKGTAADALQADFTPEAFLLDGDFVVRYRGRIDNAYSARLKRSYGGATRHDLKQALDELLAGKPVSEPATQAVGCPLERKARSGERGAKEERKAKSEERGARSAAVRSASRSSLFALRS